MCVCVLLKIEANKSFNGILNQYICETVQDYHFLCIINVFRCLGV